MTYTLYVLHFTQPYRHARHYIGVTYLDLPQRLRYHRTGKGARLIAALIADGGDFVVEYTQTFTDRAAAFAEERRLKRHGGRVRACRLCREARRCI